MVKTMPISCTKEEMDNLIKAASEDDYYYMFFKVARKTGRRIGEYWDVQVKHIDLENKVMMTKVLKRRAKVMKEAILDDDLVYLLRRHIAQNKLKLEDYVFRKVSIRQVSNKVKYFAEKAEIPHNVSIHNFRHYFVTALVKKGWDYNKISKLTGHSNPGTLAVYDHMVAGDIAEDAREAIREL